MRHRRICVASDGLAPSSFAQPSDRRVARGMLAGDRMAIVNTDFNDPETYAIIGAAMEVHRVLGCGFLESVYRAALAIELELRSVPFVNEVPIPIRYKKRLLPMHYRADFVCFGTVLVEVKALDGLGPVEAAQVLNYLKGARLQRAILINFGATRLQHRRLVWRLAPDDDPTGKRAQEPSRE